MITAIPFTLEMMLMLGLVAIAAILFVGKFLRIDVAAMSILVLLGFCTLIPNLDTMIKTSDLFSGFSSHAVIAVLAIMIMGTGLSKAGLMNFFTNTILKKSSDHPKRIIPAIAASAALISSFMQNITAAALLLPVINRVADRLHVPSSRLLLPMGFCAILGGTTTMIGSSPLILLNDLLHSSNATLGPEQQMMPFHLFDVFPIGIALIITGVLYFTFAGQYILPKRSELQTKRTSRTAEYFERLYGIKGEFLEAKVTDDSPMVGMTLGQIETTFPHSPRVLALYSGDVVKVPPVVEEVVWVNTVLGFMGDRQTMETFCHEHHWNLHGEPNRLAEVLNSQYSGIAEVVIPPASSYVGKQIKELKPRRSFGTNILQIYRTDYVIKNDIGEHSLQPGDTLVVHASWKDLSKLTRNKDFVVATEVKYESYRTHKLREALLCFALSMVLYFLTDNLSVSLLSGAMAMVATGVLTMDEAYSSVSWQSVFLIASLLPVAQALDQTGTATWMAMHVYSTVGDAPVWALMVMIAGLTTLFTLLMSNIVATILLVPFAVHLAITVNADPAIFALTVAISSSNSFLVPTHQVNALIMGPGGYQVADFMRAGGMMTILFLLVSLSIIQLLF